MSVSRATAIVSRQLNSPQVFILPFRSSDSAVRQRAIGYCRRQGTFALNYSDGTKVSSAPQLKQVIPRLNSHRTTLSSRSASMLSNKCIRSFFKSRTYTFDHLENHPPLFPLLLLTLTLTKARNTQTKPMTTLPTSASPLTILDAP